MVHKHLAAHNIVAQCTHLREHAHVQHIEEVLKLEVENIDREVTNAVLHAEKKLANKNYGYGWSPRLALAGCTVTFWRTCLRVVHKTGKDPMMVMPLCQCQEFGLGSHTLGYKFYASKLYDAWTALHINQAALRQKFLSDLINEALLKQNKSREAALTSIKEAAYMAKLWPRLRKYSKGEVGSGLSKIEIPVFDTTGEIIDYRTLSESTEVFKHLIQRNSHASFCTGSTYPIC